MTTKLPVSPAVKVLTDTRELIDQRGWCQNALENHLGQFCVLGALLHATHGRVMGNGTDIRRDVLVALGNAAGTPATPVSLVGWNNAPGRTKGEVLATLDRAISLELGVP